MNKFELQYYDLLEWYYDNYHDIDYKEATSMMRKVLNHKLSIGKTPRGIVAGIAYANSKGVSQELISNRLDTSVPTLKKSYKRIEQIIKEKVFYTSNSKIK